MSSRVIDRGFLGQGVSTTCRSSQSPSNFRSATKPSWQDRSGFQQRGGSRDDDERRVIPRSGLRKDSNFVIELRSGREGFSKPEVEGLVKECTALYDRCFFSPACFVAARLHFRQWSNALECFVFFWTKRLDGVHALNPYLVFNVCVPSDKDELRARVRVLFAARVRKLLEGDGVQRWKKRVNGLSDEIAKIQSLLKKRYTKLATFHELHAKKKGLIAEREMVLSRLEEFKGAMNCILCYVDSLCPKGFVDESEDVEVFSFPDEYYWDRIHNVMIRECRRLDEGLPIYSRRRKILQQIYAQQVLVLIGETGSGKSTQLVQFLADSGIAGDGAIICTQPRKIAAMSLAQRVGEESSGCYEDNSIVCYPSFSSAQKFTSKVIFMTDHCLLQHYMNDKKLAPISCIIIDEAHERSLNTDLLLALLKGLLLQRLDLKLIIMSATADANKLSEYFFGCATLHVVGRNFPVDVTYVPNASLGGSTILSPSVGNGAEYVSRVVQVATDCHQVEGEGGILAFLTSQMEVEWACEKFDSPSAVALPLHGKLSWEEQQRVFQNHSGKRKVIFATNLAETSLTIPGVKYVIDSGMAKEINFEPTTGMNILKVCRISQSSANQRAGRAGRTEPGKCYRLYSECEFHSMPSHQEPEIRRVHLGIAVLRILALGIKDIHQFDFVDSPSPKAIERAIKNLIQLGAVTSKNDVLELSEIGRYLVKLGIEPQLGKLILDSCRYRLRREGLVLAAVMANASSIFCRVGNEENKLKSDCLKVQFCHRNGDLFTLLSVYKEWEVVPQENRNKWCWNNSINAKSMRRCKETVLELQNCLRNELSIVIPDYWLWKPNVSSEHDKNLKKIILSSLAENVAMYSGYERLGYQVALTGQHVQLHPSCSLHIYGQKPSWVVFSDLLSTQNQYLVCVTAFDYECLSTLYPPPPFNISKMESQKLEVSLMTGLGSILLKRLCGKASNSLLRLVSSIRNICMDERISVEVDVAKREIQLFASSADMEKVHTVVHDAVEYERRWLIDECFEKGLYRGRPGAPPSLALFGAGAEIKYLELGKRYLTVEIFHSEAHTLNDKELLMLFGKHGCGISGFHKYAGLGDDSDKWGRITFLTPDAAEKAVLELNGVELKGSKLKVSPSRITFGGDNRSVPFPAIKARISWPRRSSKGFAIVRCEKQNVESVVNDFSNLLVGRRFVRCELSQREDDSVVISGLDKEMCEPEILDALRAATSNRILEVYLLRGEAVETPTCAACEDALLKEIAPFMPSRISITNCCQVQVFPPEPKDYMMKAQITFDGTLHLEAARALEHIQGKVLSGCHSWQKIQCQQMFHSFLSCPASVYPVIKKDLDSLFASFKRRKGISCNLERNENGSYRVKIFANATKTLVELRKPLEQLMKGRTINHAKLPPRIAQLLFSIDGIGLLKSIQRETGTFILYDKQRMNVKVFGPEDKAAVAESRLVESIATLHENRQLDICLRGGGLPHDLMKGLIEKFGPDLHGLKEKVPGAEFTLNIRRHVLSVNGPKELKKNVEEIVCEIGRSLSGRSGNILASWTDGELTCPICLCEVDDSFQLEACNHIFCRSCLVDQFESAIRNRDIFPILCTHKDCKAPILVADLRSLLTIEKLEELFRASLGAFVASSGGRYRFCPSPDCPSIYQVSEPGTEPEPFVCGACSVETCTGCHLEYHPSVSCERYREFKEDPDQSLKFWRNGKEDVKSCPKCGYTIEKAEGCNHIECRCGAHICWVCLESFKSSDACYGHLRSVHHAFI